MCPCALAPISSSSLARTDVLFWRGRLFAERKRTPYGGVFVSREDTSTS